VGARQRTELISASVAADILGVHLPHLARLRKQGRMPAPVPVEGGVRPVYRRAEVNVLARQLERERRERRR
jgi:hypothetical protein